LKKTISIITTALLVIVLLLAFALVGVRLFGLAPYTVLSGSMEPTYHVGAILYVKDVDPGELAVGDPLTFRSESAVVTHRIIELVPDEQDPTLVRFRTQGDANEFADGALVHPNNVIGRPVFSLPLLGYLAVYMKQPPGLYVTMLLFVLTLVSVFVPDMLSRTKEDDSSTPPPAN
jgi:signal peptidase